MPLTDALVNGPVTLMSASARAVNVSFRATSALSANLVASYEGTQPDLTTAILEAHGFSDLLERITAVRRQIAVAGLAIGVTGTLATAWALA